MQSRFKDNVPARLITLLLIMLPLLILFLLPGGSMATGLLFWLLAFLSVALVWSFLGRPADDGLPVVDGPRRLELEEQPATIRRHMNVDDAIEVPHAVPLRNFEVALIR